MRRPGPRLTSALAALALVLAAGPAAAADGDPARGRETFLERCAGCHTLAEAGATGTYGPDLDHEAPLYREVVRQVTRGGGGMPPFRAVLDAATITDVATYVWRAARPTVAPARPPRAADGLVVDLRATLSERPTALGLLPAGDLLIGTAEGRLWRLAAGASAPTLASEAFRDAILGLAAVDETTVLVADLGRVQALELAPDGSVASARPLVDGLPYGLNANAGIALKDGRAYLGIGSTCDACRERDPRAATVASVRLDGTGFRVEARGLRAVGALVVDDGRRLWAVDAARTDRPGLRDELDLVRRGARYGWPACPSRVPGAGRCRGTVAPAFRLASRSAPSGLAVLPPAWGTRRADDLVVALRGAGAVTEIDMARGRPVGGARILRGLERPTAVAVGADGTLLVADAGTGAIWRVRRG